jgi:hypothetical protein
MVSELARQRRALLFLELDMAEEVEIPTAETSERVATAKLDHPEYRWDQKSVEQAANDYKIGERN